MTDVKRLLAEATPLPWRVFDGPRPGIDGGDNTSVVVYGEPYEEEAGFAHEADAQLAVHAVNNLPAYEEAVEALVAVQRDYYGDVPCWCDTEVDEHSEACVQARAALARLRGDA